MTEAKISKEAAAYVDRAPNKHCEDCTMFREAKQANYCTLVKGIIRRWGSCKYFEKAKLPVGA